MKDERGRGDCDGVKSWRTKTGLEEVGSGWRVRSSSAVEVEASQQNSRQGTMDKVRRWSLLTAWFLNLSTVNMLQALSHAGCLVASLSFYPLDVQVTIKRLLDITKYLLGEEEVKSPLVESHQVRKPGEGTNVRKLLSYTKGLHFSKKSVHMGRREMKVGRTWYNMGAGAIKGG